MMSQNFRVIIIIIFRLFHENSKEHHTENVERMLFWRTPN